MDFSKIGLFQAMKTRMDYASERQDILAEDIANIDTPGYKGRDLKPLDFDKLATAFARKLSMRTTSASHQNPAGNNVEFKEENKLKKPYEIKPVKNRVNLEEQMMKMNENSFDYLTMTNLYGKTAALFKTAIGNRN